MNLLVVGRDKTPILDHISGSFLLIDDGEIIDQLTLPKHRKVERLEFSKDSFNPLQKISHRRARQFADTIYSAYAQGENTLTVRNGKRALTRLVLNAESLDKLPRSKADDITEANATIDDVLLSPVLRHFLCNRTNFTFSGIILARLDPTELDELDCFIIANLLIANYSGQIVIPDFGFYSCKFHKSLIRQQRLIAGVNYLDETPLKPHLLLIDKKIGSHCTIPDAKTLADYAGIRPATVGYNEYVEDAIE